MVSETLGREPLLRQGGLRRLFWEQDFDALRWPGHRDLLTARILAEGDSAALHWLRERLTDDELRAWIRTRRGRPLSARQLRYWQIILDLPPAEVDAWLSDPGRRIWEERASR